MKSIDIFPWNENFDTGIAVIDEQHRRLVELLNTLAGEIATGTSAQGLSRIFSALTEYTHYHFQTEEAIWLTALHDQEAVTAHQETHQSFVAELRRLQAAFERNGPDAAADETLGFLARWLASHILESDRYMACVVRATERGLRGELAHAQAKEEMGGATRVLIDIILSIYATLSGNTLRLMRELLAHRQVDEALGRELEYRALILRLAMSFINLPLEKLGHAIEAALAEMAQFFEADRAYVFRYDFAQGTASNTYEWCAKGIAPMIDQLQNLPLANSPEWIEPHQRGEAFIVTDAGLLPSGTLRDLLQSQQIFSLLTAPLMDGTQCLGFVGFDAVRSGRQYDRDEQDVLALFANLLVSLQQRKAVADALHEKSAALERSHRQVLNILDGTNAAVYVADMQTFEVLYINAYAEALLGDVVGKICWQVIQQDMTGPCSFCTNNRLLNTDGSPADPVVWEYFNPRLGRWFQLHDRAIAWADGRYVRMEIALDITERKEMEQSLRDSEERYRLLFEQSRDAMIIVTPPKWRFVAGNPAMLDMFRLNDLESLKRLSPVDLSPTYQPDGSASAEKANALLETALKTGSCFAEWTHRRLDGTEIPCTVLLTRTELSGQVVVQGTVRDISLQKAQQQQLERMAHFDPLTGLPNRVLLADRMRQAMAQAVRRDTRVAIAYLDLDGFKMVNDLHGHAQGDRLLIELSTRMRQTLRESDTLARMGGDEFVAVLIDLGEGESYLPTLRRLLEAASSPVVDGDLSLQVSASLGVTLFPQTESIDADQLLRQADQAMYQAKLAGKNRIRIFDMAHDHAVRGHHEDLARLGRALDDREFVLFYQPKVNMRTGEVLGLEALIRWQHPDRGLLAPADFLPIIETHPLSIALGEWVIDSALKQMRIWRQAGLALPVSINIDAQQLQQPGFTRTISDHLARYPDIPPSWLEIEVLESSALHDIRMVAQIIVSCSAQGVRFALDDFGTGYASLTYLKNLPADTLKIDRSFVRDMLEDPDDLAILKGVIELARAFRRMPIAEGVETVAQGERLLDLGCEHAQGYVIARPMPADEVAQWITNWQVPESWFDRLPHRP